MSARPTKRRVLLMVHTNTWFTEMFNLARFLRDSDRYEPVVHFAYRYPTAGRDIGRLRTEGIEHSEAPRHASPKIFDRALGALSRLPQRPSLAAVPNFLTPAVRASQNLAVSLKEISYYKKLVKDQRARLVVLAGDLVGYNTPEIVRAAHDTRVPCIIIPSTMSDGTEQAEAYFFDENFGENRPFNRLVGARWPHWKKEHKGKGLIRLPGEQIIPRELLKIAPPLPWISSSSLADRVAVESSAMWDYYRRCGIEAEKLHRTGTLANDAMAKVTADQKELRSRLLKNLNLAPQKGVVLTALPPDFLYMVGGRPNCEFSDYKSLTKYWTDSLDRLKNFNTVISLHPSVEAEDFRYLETERVRIASERIVDLIPLCDLFVASVSSTIRWAITCSRPVVNYDVYQYHYADFTGVKGVVFVDRKEVFQEVLRRIDTDPAFQQHLKTEISGEASYWGCLDGAEGARMLLLFDEEISRWTLPTKTF